MRKLLWLTLAMVVSAALVAGTISRTRRGKVIIDVAKVEKDLHEHLNVGASRAEVESYLDQRGIQHSYIAQSMARPEDSRTELAMIRESSRSWLVRGDIHIVFKFDDREKLTHYSVTEIYTGP
jgi:hypothetical protein